MPSLLSRLMSKALISRPREIGSRSARNAVNAAGLTFRDWNAALGAARAQVATHLLPEHLVREPTVGVRKSAWTENEDPAAFFSTWVNGTDFERYVSEANNDYGLLRTSVRRIAGSRPSGWAKHSWPTERVDVDTGHRTPRAPMLDEYRWGNSANDDDRPLGRRGSRATGKAHFTSWTCREGPEELVHFLVQRGKTVTYRTFATQVHVREAPVWWDGMPTDWSAEWLKTELPSGRRAWVLRHGGIEHLFTDDGTWDQARESRLARTMERRLEKLVEAGEVGRRGYSADFGDLTRSQLDAIRPRSTAKP